MKQILLSILFLFAIQLSYAQNELFIVNPEWGGWWGGGEAGNIEEATFLIEPKGIYTEVEMFLTFASTWGDVGSDSLEIVLNFDLPDGAIIHDSWLWVYDTPVQADMLDKWTAIQTYEDIVDRRTDPSLLFEENNGFQLRIYPLTADERRKVKITILMPTVWSSDFVRTSLPTHILRTSYNELPFYRVLVKPTDKWENPLMTGNPNGSEFMLINDSEFGNVLEMVVTDDGAENKDLVFDAPLENGIYLNTYEGEANMYQLVLDPAEFGVAPDSRKVVFTANLEQATDNFFLMSAWDEIRAVGSDILTDNDSFNIVYRGENGDLLQLFNEWQSFEIANMTDFPIVYQDGDIIDGLLHSVNFIESNGGEGDIILITNTNEITTFEMANDLIDNLTAIVSAQTSIDIFDFRNGNLNSAHLHFYNKITDLTGGTKYHNTVTPENIDEAFSDFFNTLENVEGFQEVYTSVSDGICLFRYDIDNGHSQYTNDNSFSLHHPIKQVGQYFGELPFEIEYSTVIDNIINFNQFSVDTSQIITGDTLNEEMWIWNRLQEMEANTSGNGGIPAIVDLSMENRVLSAYTAFLAIEPTVFTDEGCFNCDGEILIDTEEIPVSDDLFQIKAFPNPFTTQTLINITISANVDLQEMEFAIYDQLGRLVAQPRIVQRLSDEKLQLSWNGQNEKGDAVATGTYYLSVVSEQGQGNYKLLKI